MGNLPKETNYTQKSAIGRVLQQDKNIKKDCPEAEPLNGHLNSWQNQKLIGLNYRRGNSSRIFS